MSATDDNDKNKPRSTEFETRRVIRIGDQEIVEISITQIVEEEQEVDPPPPPPFPPGWTQRFDSIREWLFYLCNAYNPPEKIVAYYFCIDGSPESYIVLFTCNWKFDPADKEWVYYVDNELQESYMLPAAEYKGLSREEALKKFAAELKAFSETEQFKQSFFAKAKAIGTGFFQEETILIK